MVPPPSVIGLWICEQVIIDSKTNNPSLISVYTGRAYASFPTEAIPFSIFCSLTDASGSAILRLAVEHLESGSEVFAHDYSVEFPSRLAVVNLHVRLKTLRFPMPGTYAFDLFSQGKSLAQRRLRVYQAGDSQDGI